MKSLEEQKHDAWENHKDNNEPVGQQKLYYKDNREYFGLGFDSAIAHLREIGMSEFDAAAELRKHFGTVNVGAVEAVEWALKQNAELIGSFKFRVDWLEKFLDDEKKEITVLKDKLEIDVEHWHKKYVDKEKEIVALKAENETIKSCRDYSVYEQQKQEITDMRKQLDDANHKLSLFKNTSKNNAFLVNETVRLRDALKSVRHQAVGFCSTNDMLTTIDEALNNKQTEEG